MQLICVRCCSVLQRGSKYFGGGVHFFIAPRLGGPNTSQSVNWGGGSLSTGTNYCRERPLYSDFYVIVIINFV